MMLEPPTGLAGIFPLPGGEGQGEGESPYILSPPECPGAAVGKGHGGRSTLTYSSGRHLRSPIGSALQPRFRPSAPTARQLVSPWHRHGNPPPHRTRLPCRGKTPLLIPCVWIMHRLPPAGRTPCRCHHIFEVDGKDEEGPNFVSKHLEFNNEQPCPTDGLFNYCCGRAADCPSIPGRNAVPSVPKIEARMFA